MTISFSFEPDPARARALDRRMHAALGGSLEHIGERIAGKIPHDAAALHRLVASLKAGQRASPATFGRYYDLVESIGNDDLSGAEARLAALLEPEPAGPDLAVLPIDDPRLRGVVDLYRRKMDTDPQTKFEFLDPPPELVPPFAARFSDAMALLDRALPALSGEVRGLLSQVVLAVGRPGASYAFDGGSSYMLWGALFLNARFHETRIAMAEVIAHESAHTLLFGFTVDEPLVFNADDQLYASPLRVDPRPMDGIYHATFVSARMHWVMTELANSGALDAAETDAAREAASTDRRNFFAGLETVRKHADLSATGAALVASAESYMAAAA